MESQHGRSCMEDMKLTSCNRREQCTRELLQPATHHWKASQGIPISYQYDHSSSDMEVQGKEEEHPNIIQRPRRELTERIHRGLTEDSQRTYSWLTEDSQRTPRGLTENSQRFPRGPIEDSQRTHRHYTEDSQRTRRGLTKDSQRTRRGLADCQRTHRGCTCLLYTSPSPRDRTRSRMPSSA